MSLHQQLSTVELEIASLCRRHGVSPDTDEICIEDFTDQEADQLHTMLKQKLELQERIFHEQSGEVSNVVFMSKYRKDANGNPYR